MEQGSEPPGAGSTSLSGPLDHALKQRNRAPTGHTGHEHPAQSLPRQVLPGACGDISFCKLHAKDKKTLAAGLRPAHGHSLHQEGGKATTVLTGGAAQRDAGRPPGEL